MSIKIKPLDVLNERQKNTMVGFLGIEITEITENSISGKMPVDERHAQIWESFMEVVRLFLPKHWEVLLRI